MSDLPVLKKDRFLCDEILTLCNMSCLSSKLGTGLGFLFVIYSQLLNKSTTAQVNSLQIYFYGLVQDCSISNALAMEVLPSCTEPSISSTSLYLLEWARIGKVLKSTNPTNCIVHKYHLQLYGHRMGRPYPRLWHSMRAVSCVLSPFCCNVRWRLLMPIYNVRII